MSEEDSLKEMSSTSAKEATTFISDEESGSQLLTSASAEEATTSVSDEESGSQILTSAESSSLDVQPEIRITSRNSRNIMFRNIPPIRVSQHENTSENQIGSPIPIYISVCQVEDIPPALYVQIINCPHINPEQVRETLEEMVDMMESDPQHNLSTILNFLEESNGFEISIGSLTIPVEPSTLGIWSSISAGSSTSTSSEESSAESECSPNSILSK